jgi:hypothetical protein
LLPVARKLPYTTPPLETGVTPPAPVPTTGAVVPNGIVTSAPYCGHGNADVK